MKLTSTNPSRNYEIVGEVEVSTEQDIKNAVEKARAAQPAWAALSQAERNEAISSFVELCKQNTEEIATAVSREMGKPIAASRRQVNESSGYFRAYMAMADKALAPEMVFEDDTQIHHLTREPLGVVACITPWNFPMLNIPMQAGQALIAGNTIVYKPSEEIVVFAQLIARLVAQSKLPDGVFTVLFGDGSVGEQLVRQPVDAILFTGSTRTGQRITDSRPKIPRGS